MYMASEAEHFSGELGGVLIWISLCNPCVLCVSVVNRFAGIDHHRGIENTEVAQRRTSN
jgi:hypothetical protein